MCSISGIIDYKNNNFDKELVDFKNLLFHRGPDHQVIIKDKNFFLSMNRLKIIDLSDNANQPFKSEDSNFVLIYNGEIYNYKELKKNYFSDYSFKSNVDGEILIPLFKQFGISFLSKIRGMYSIFLYDKKNETSYLVRDRFGIKPLYYNFDNKHNRLTFASEIKGVFANKKISREPNFKEIYRYLEKGMVNATRETWFKDIYQVTQGCFLKYKKNEGINEYKYYDLKDNIDEDVDKDKTFSLKKNLENIGTLFEKSFIEHSQFDVSAGFHVSGGIDSAIMMALAHKNKMKDSKAFTFSFKDKIFSELENSMKISSKFNFIHHSSYVENEDMPNFLTNVLKREYEPFSSLRILSQHHLYEKFKDNGIKVIFDGSGGDEIGAGYNYYLSPWLMDNFENSPSNKLMDRYIHLTSKSKNFDNNEISKKILGNFIHFNVLGKTTVDGSVYEKSNTVNNDFKISNSEANLYLDYPFKSYLRNAQYNDIYSFKLPRCLRYTDRASMYSSVEARVPFLDHRLVEACINVPSLYKILNSNLRFILKKPFEKILGKEIVYKNKNTLADPQKRWLRTTLKPLIQDLFLSSDIKTNMIFDQSSVKKLIENFYKSDERVNSFFFTQILLTELWFREVL